MHEVTLRWICRSLFLALGVGPTALVLFGVLNRGWGDPRGAAAAAIADATGLEATVARWDYPRPLVARGANLVVADPDDGRPVATAQRLERNDAADPRQLTVEEVELDATRLAALWDRCETFLLRHAGRAGPPTRLLAARLRLRAGDEQIEIHDLRADLLPQERKLRGQLRLSDWPPEKQLRWIAARPPDNPRRLAVELHTDGEALPGRWLALLDPRWASLGETWTFAGSVWLERGSTGWSGRIVGRFDHIDLAQLLGAGFGLKTTGSAALLGEIQVADNRIQEAYGEISAGPGVVSRRFVDALVRRMHVVPNAVLQGRTTAAIGYERWVARFHLGAGGLTLHGNCPGGPAGALLMDERDALLSEPALQPIPAAALLQALAPDADAWAPATAEVEGLFRVLPLPRQGAR